MNALLFTSTWKMAQDNSRVRISSWSRERTEGASPTWRPASGLLLVSLAMATLFSGDSLLNAQESSPAKDKAKENENFSIVLLPDTQNYAEKYPDTYVAQTLWVRKRVEKDNIKFVIHLGDIVQTSTKEPEWENADRAMRLLDGVVPYSVAPGNHDMVVKDRDSSLYNQFFPPSRFTGRKWYGGHMGESNDNNYCFFEAAGLKFMVVNLEFAPRDETLEWAAGIMKKHPGHRVIVATHCYMRPQGRDTSCAMAYKVAGNSGEGMWQKLIRKQSNIFLVVSGHVLGVGFQTSVNDAGGKVMEMLTDYQGLPNGGDGWLRSLEFVPSKNEIRVKTYSPVLDEFKKEKEQSFTVPYDMTNRKRKAG